MTKSWIHRLSQPALLLGVVFVVLIAVSRPELLVLNASAAESPTLWMIWSVSVGFIAIGLLSALHDVWRLKEEWQAVEKVRKVDIATQSPEARIAGTVVGSRWRAVTQQPPYGRPATRWFDSQRAQAQSVLGSLGASTRFISGTLLLLAVLGTFAGMKDAIPELIKAIENAGSSAAQTSAPINTALTRVGEAFGANFVALVGSLVLALSAYGAASERRFLLTAIEAVSDDSLYAKWVHAPTEQEALGRAIDELQQGVVRLTAVAEGNAGFQEELSNHARTLKSAIGSLQTALAESVRTQTVVLEQNLSATFGQLSTDIGSIATVLANTSIAYAGLVASMQARHGDLDAAATKLAEVEETARLGLAQSTDRIRDAIEAATSSHAELVESTQRATKDTAVALGVVSDAAQGLQAAAATQQEAAGDMKAVVTDLGQLRREWLDELGLAARRQEEQSERLLVGVSQSQKALARAAEGLADTTTSTAAEFKASVQQLVSGVNRRMDQEQAARAALDESQKGTLTALRQSLAEGVDQMRQTSARGAEMGLAIREALEATQMNTDALVRLQDDIRGQARELSLGLAGQLASAEKISQALDQTTRRLSDLHQAIRKTERPRRFFGLFRGS